MNISPIEPISQAWNHMVRILFKPFEIKKWFVLGFCAFLAQCDEMGGNGGNFWSGNNNTNVGGFDEGKAWIETNFSLVSNDSHIWDNSCDINWIACNMAF